ncbi:MAG TPA: ubiquitin-like small modifier protein 1 [Acidimicrobiales bacterium]|nr:ubiquitin-like small modifier protein 1 [Acidimicrobiales bacterium]
MSVDVRLPTILRPLADGKAVVSADGATIGDVFADLVKKFPGLNDRLLNEDGTLHKFVNVYLGDDDVRYLDKLETKIGDHDEISILPAVAGG